MKIIFLIIFLISAITNFAHAKSFAEELGLAGYYTKKVELVVSSYSEAGIIEIRSEHSAMLKIKMRNPTNLAEAIIEIPAVVRAQKNGVNIKGRSTIFNETYALNNIDGSKVSDLFGRYVGGELSAAFGLNLGEMIVVKDSSSGQTIILTDFQNIFNADKAGFTALGFTISKVTLVIDTSVKDQVIKIERLENSEASTKTVIIDTSIGDLTL